MRLGELLQDLPPSPRVGGDTSLRTKPSDEPSTCSERWKTHDMAFMTKRRWRFLAIALGFAVVVTGMCLGSYIAVSGRWAAALWNLYLVVNFCGACLAYLAQGGRSLQLVSVDPSLGIGYGATLLGWIGYFLAVFAAATVQGLIYVALGSAILRCWRRRTNRAGSKPIAA